MSTKLLPVFAWIALLVPGAIFSQSVPVKDDPLVRMPGTQPGMVTLEGPGRCMNCHAGYNTAVEPGHNWSGSMMAQSARDPLFWACMTVAAQDSVWALGNPNATDICLRCHFPKGWLEGRSDPTNASLMIADDYDGVQCDFCHKMFNPFFEDTHAGVREGSDWLNYWDETNISATPSQQMANSTYAADVGEASTHQTFNAGQFFDATNQPFSSEYIENGSGQYFVAANGAKRASFADAAARHQMFYSRYHKSKFFCATCHDVSNPILQNLGADPNTDLPTELASAHSYFHVERTFSEFMLSAYGQQGGAAGIGPFAPQKFTTSDPNNKITKCQDCHMRDVSGAACNKKGAPVRPGESLEHPNSGQPLHDLTGGNIWISTILASAVPGSPNYDATNDALLNQGPSVLTLDMTAGLGLNPSALLDGASRAQQQLQLAASIQNVAYDKTTGALAFKIQNHTGHKLISGFPEGRRMFVNIRVFQSGTLIYEVNPYDYAAGTLKGIEYNHQPDADLPLPSAISQSTETKVDELIYECRPSSSITDELEETFHFALATNRYKDNRIPPKGFRIAEAANRLSQPRHDGSDAPNYFTADEYAGGYDAVTVSVPAGADYVEINLYYQTTSREYVEFLRDEINGNPNNQTLTADAYITASDPFFGQLHAWGDTIWNLWKHNMNAPGAKPVLIAQGSYGTTPPPGPGPNPTPQCDAPSTPLNVVTTEGRRSITLSWDAPNPAPTGGYRVYYDQSGKLQFLADSNNTTYRDNRLSHGVTYCYVVTAWNDCDGDGTFNQSNDNESASSPVACATAQ